MLIHIDVVHDLDVQQVTERSPCKPEILVEKLDDIQQLAVPKQKLAELRRRLADVQHFSFDVSSLKKNTET